MGCGGFIAEFFNYCPNCREEMNKEAGPVKRCDDDGRWHYYRYYKCPKCKYRGKNFREDNCPCNCP